MSTNEKRFTVKITPNHCNNKPVIINKLIPAEVLHLKDWCERYGQDFGSVVGFFDALAQSAKDNVELCYDDHFRAYNCRDNKTGKAFLHCRATGILRDASKKAKLTLVDKDMQPTTVEAVMAKATKVNETALTKLSEKMAVPLPEVECPYCHKKFPLARPLGY